MMILMRWYGGFREVFYKGLFVEYSNPDLP